MQAIESRKRYMIDKKIFILILIAFNAVISSGSCGESKYPILDTRISGDVYNQVNEFLAKENSQIARKLMESLEASRKSNFSEAEKYRVGGWYYNNIYGLLISPSVGGARFQFRITQEGQSIQVKYEGINQSVRAVR